MHETAKGSSQTWKDASIASGPGAKEACDRWREDARASGRRPRVANLHCERTLGSYGRLAPFRAAHGVLQPAGCAELSLPVEKQPDPAAFEPDGQGESELRAEAGTAK